MPQRDRAAYMRDYRARRRGTAEPGLDPAIRIAQLEDEVARLKRELAARPAPVLGHSFNSRPFQPVPKRPAK